MRKAINLISIENRKILLVKKGEVWILPGGKPEDGESDFDCLFRELSEELPGLAVEGKFRHYKNFSGVTPHIGDVLEAITYFASTSGETNTAMEISEAAWVSASTELKLSEITAKIIKSLEEDGYL